MADRHRIVSLLPSTTEIACALGLQDELVGRSHECDYPPGVASLPALTSARFRDGTSREIDDRVRELVERGLSVYDVNATLLRELEPSLVLTQDQCQVCAASLGDVEAALRDWTGSAPALVSLEPSTLGDVFEDISRVGDAAGVPERAASLRAELTLRVTQIGEQSGEQSGDLRPRPRVACVEWIDPLMAAGNWMPELVTLAGGDSLFGATGSHSPYMEWKNLRAADPDVVVIIPCGFDIERSRAEAEALSRLAGWKDLRAVADGRVYVCDGNAYFNRSGPRLVESLEILAELLHPGRFQFGHEGPGWQRL
jgi:iron complex transport system substrate-binding protein